jgi:hypothetical protein
VELLRRWELLEPAEVRPLQDGSELGLSKSEQEGLRSELLLWSPATRESFKGYDGILKLLALKGNHPILASIGAWWMARRVGKWAYSLVSLNRRILSPPATGGIACECDPPFHLGYRSALFTVLCLILLGGAFLYGASLPGGTLETAVKNPWAKVLLAAGAGWALSLVAFLAALPGRFRDVFWQSLVVLALGALLLLPLAAANFLLVPLEAPPRAFVLLNSLTGAASLFLMLMATRRRHQRLGLPSWTPWLWLVSTCTGALVAFLIFA